MPIHYIVIEQENPRNRDEKIYYARAVSDGAVDMDALARELEKMSTLSAADVYGVLYGLVDRVSHHLSEGRIVRLGALGSLRVSLKSSKCDSGAAVDASSIEGVRLVIRPGKRLREQLDRLEFKRIKPFDE